MISEVHGTPTLRNTVSFQMSMFSVCNWGFPCFYLGIAEASSRQLTVRKRKRPVQKILALKASIQMESIRWEYPLYGAMYKFSQQQVLWSVSLANSVIPGIQFAGVPHAGYRIRHVYNFTAITNHSELGIESHLAGSLLLILNNCHLSAWFYVIVSASMLNIPE